MSLISFKGTDVNLKVTLYLTDVDKAIATDTLVITPISPNITTQDLQQGINAGDPALNMSGVAVISIPAEHCTDVTYVCAEVTAASTGSYIDVKTDNNIKCNDITAQKVCGSGIVTICMHQTLDVK